MKRLRWPLLIAILALVTIAVLLLGRQPVLTPVEPVIEPATGGVYAEGLVGKLIRLNPLLDYFNQPDRDIDRLIFSGLLRFDDRGLPVGELADSWGISRDGMVYNVSIQPEAVWHDGEPVTSDDVLFTIEMLRDDASLLPPDLREMWRQVDVKALDEKTLQFRLPEPYSPFLDTLTFGILPAHLLSGLTFDEMINDSFNLAPVGSGPYRFDRLIVEEGQIKGVVLKAFKDFYREPAYIDELVFRYYPDEQTALEAYKEREVLGIDRSTLTTLPTVLREPELNLYTGRLPELSMIFLNLGNSGTPFLQDAAVRRALLMGLNRQGMIDRILGGQAILADGPIFPSTWAYYDGTQRVPFDPEGAIELLKSAGYTLPAEGGAVRQNEEGTSLALELLYPIDSPQHIAIAEEIQQDWGEIGVGVTLKGVTYRELVDEYLSGRAYQAALVDINLARSPDPDPYPFWHQAQASGGQNYSNWDDRQASEYLEAARITTDLGERTKLYNNFQVRFNQELPALPLFYPVYNYAVDGEVQGLRMGPLFEPSDRYNTATDWFLITKRTLDNNQQVSTPEASPPP